MNMKWLNWIIIIPFLFLGQVAILAADTDEETKDIQAFLIKLYEDRAHFLFDQKEEAISKYYDQTNKTGKYAFEQERLRGQYINTWAEKRGIAFSNAESSIRIVRIKKKGDSAKVSLYQSLKIGYRYKNGSYNVQSFGVGTRHGLTLKKMNGAWLVFSEWYSDPLTENPKWIPEFEGFPNTAFLKSKTDTELNNDKKKLKYNRECAVEYANKYAGATWGAGNNQRYNKKYLDYTNSGGDCTNFASQVLGDKEGGGLRMKSGWHYRSGGSVAWIRTDSFKNFLLYSGYGKLVAKGFFSEVVKPTEKYPGGAFAALKPGDLIAYEMEGDIDHFSILTGFDDHGYPLVNSHSADRYRVPFDLGWDKNTKYLLIHIND